MFALIAWTSLIFRLGNLTASISGKSGHAFIVYSGLCVAHRILISVFAYKNRLYGKY